MKTNDLGRNRGLNFPSTAGDPNQTEGMQPVNELGFTKGHLLGQPTEGGAQQAFSSKGPENTFGFFSGGEKELLGQDPDEGIQDDAYPSTPDPALAGGGDVAWDSVAPYRYPEFPAESNASDVGSSSAAVPLT